MYSSISLFPQIPDYLVVIKKPMDLSTLLTNIDKHKYLTVSEFLSDADLIWQNALEYNPDKDPMGESTIDPIFCLMVCTMIKSWLISCAGLCLRP